MPRLNQPCDRARAAISMELDGELSELDRHRMQRHLARCEACRGFQEDASTFTMRLRLAPLEPVPVPMGGRFRRRGRRSAGAISISSAAAVAVAGLLFGSNLARDSGGGAGTPSGPAASTSAAVGAATPHRLRLPIGQRSAADDF